MNTFVLYLAESNAYLALFAVAYALFWRKQVDFLANRMVLLGLLVVALILPLATFSPLPTGIQTWQVQLPTIHIGAAGVDHQQQTWGMLWQVAGAVYLTGVLISACQLAVQFWHTTAMIRRARDKQRLPSGMTLVHASVPASSFFHYIFQEKGADSTFDSLIHAHERVHARELHSADMLLLRAVQVLCWFNPAIYYMRRAMAMNHEYRADQVVVFEYGDPTHYSTLLISKAMGVDPKIFSHAFSDSETLKKRIKMIHRQPTNRTVVRMRYALLLPVCLVAFLIHGCESDADEGPQADQPQQKSIQDVVDQVEYMTEKIPVGKKVPGTDYYLTVDVMPEFPGGESALMAYLGREITYPASARDEGIEGIVFVSFVVTAEGFIEEIKVLRSPDERLSASALKAIERMPKWTPGSFEGQEVAVQYNLPVQYRLKE